MQADTMKRYGNIIDGQIISTHPLKAAGCQPMNLELVGGFSPTPLKHMIVNNGFIFPSFRAEK